MSTHDYVIDNQSAPAFRADLNNVLAAIASQNSSGTAPTVTFANMIWYDTTNNQIKKRNEANSAWITLGTIDETAGTFTPSGERALASQAQAESGTDNATLMTPLRTFEAIGQANSAPVKTALNASGSAPIYGVRAWVNYSSSGTSQTLKQGGNVSSITYVSDGIRRVNFTTAMPHADYSVTATGDRGDGLTDVYVSSRSLTTTSCEIVCFDQYANRLNGMDAVCVTVVC